MRQEIAARLLSTLGIWFAIQAGAIVPSTFAADDKATEKQGKIVLYADFLKEAPQSSRGLHVVDPATDTWTKIATFPPRNGIFAMHYLRISPDGTKVAFNEFQEAKLSLAYPTSVWLREIRPGDEPRKISDIDGRPIWSPDGRQLLLVECLGEFDANKPGRYATWRVNVDGSHPVRLPIPDSDEVRDWSADGRWLAAVDPVSHDGTRLDIVVMHPDGSDRRRLTESGANLWPRFSPDSRRVAYTSSSKEGKSLWVVDLDGSHRRRIYAERGDSFIERIAWSPDGNQAAAVLLTWTRTEKGGRIMGGETLGSPRLCILNLDDGGLRIIPHPPASILGDPDWR